MITGTALSFFRSSRQTSNPDASGSATSRRTRLGRAASTCFRPSAPLSASRTWYPSCVHAARTSRRVAASPSTISTLRAPFASCDTVLNPNRIEGLLGDVSFQAPNVAACLFLQADQPRAGFRELEPPGTRVSHLLAPELGLEEAQAMPRVIRTGARRRHAPQVVVPTSILGGGLDRRPPGEVVAHQLGMGAGATREKVVRPAGVPCHEHGRQCFPRLRVKSDVSAAPWELIEKQLVVALRRQVDRFATLDRG